MIETDGFAVWSDIPTKSAIRLTLSERTRFDPPGLFARNVQTLINELPARARLIAFTRPYLSSSSTNTVVDTLTQGKTTGAELLQRLEALSGNWAIVRRAELLNESQKRSATSERGSEERARLQSDTQKSDDKSGLGARISEAFATTLSTAKWIAVAVVLFLVISEVRKRSAQ